MALNIVLGGAGCGKSRLLRDTVIRRSIEEPEKTFLVIVPEQFTLETQREYVTSHPDGGILNIDVLSFVRLAYRVFEDCSFDAPETLTDTGKAMIIKRVMLEKKDSLTVFKRNISRPGFIDEMKSLISEFLQYDIDSEALSKMLEASRSRDLLSRKLEDISLIFSGYSDHVRAKGNMISGEELMHILAELLIKTGYLKGKVVCLDGFTGFTPSQYALLEAIIRGAEDVYVSVTGEERILKEQISDFDILHLSGQTVSRLRKLAAINNIDENIVISDYHRGNKALAHLERNIFKPSGEAFEGCADNIHIVSAEDRGREVEFITGQIERLVREEGLRYREIAVVTGALEEYRDLFLRAFDAVNIPFFPDEKTSVMSDPLIEFIRSALDAAVSNFDFDSVFRFAKCGLTGFNPDELSELENYVRAMGFRGTARWESEWTVAFSRPYPSDLSAINALRERICSTLVKFVKDIKKEKKASGRLALIEELAQSFEVQEQLEGYAQKLSGSEDINKRVKALEYSQIYNETFECIHELASILGDEEMELSELVTILEAGFGDIKMRLLPAGTDQIVVGDLERTRLREIKVLFVAGVNEGIIPRTAQGGGILSEYERGVLSDMNFELAPTKRESICISEFYLYLLFSKPTQKLFLSYIEKDNDGKPTGPAYPVKSILNVFPKISVKRAADTPMTPDGGGKDVYDILGLDTGITFLLDALNSETDEMLPRAASIYGSLKARAYGFFDPDRFITELMGHEKYGAISRAAAEKLYGKILKGSVSRLEKFTQCAFAHFLNYGLRLQENREFTPAAPDIGSIYHRAMELYSKELKDKKLLWHDVPAQVRDSLIPEVAKRAVEEQETVYFASSKRAAHMLKGFERVIRRSILTIEEQVRDGRFEPDSFEKSFTYKINSAELTGVIDRIDRATGPDGKEYFRVIDYKSGNVEFDPAKFYYGLQVQLLVYMEATRKLLREDGVEAEPAALLYYHLSDPVTSEKNNPETEIRKALAMDGIINSKTDLVLLNSSSLGSNGEYGAIVSSASLKLKTTKAKAPDSASKNRLYSDKQLANMTKHLLNRLNAASEEIMNGNVEAVPAIYGKSSPCDWCSFKKICKAAGNKNSGRRLGKLKKDKCMEILAELYGEE